MSRTWYTGTFVVASCTNLTVLSHNAIPTPPVTTLRDLICRNPDSRPVRTEGIVIDACADDIHAKWATLILEDNGEKTFVVVERQGDHPFDFSPVLGARVSVVGIHCAATGSLRKTVRNVILIDSADMISVIAPPPPDNAPSSNVEDFSFLKTENLCAITRCEASGHVIASWDGGNVLLLTDSNSLVKGELSQQPFPVYGERIRLVGIPETDLYLPILVRARWHPLPKTVFKEPPVKAIAATDLQTDDFGSQQFNFRYNGKPVRIQGKVKNMPTKGKAQTFYIDSDGQMVLIDISGAPLLQGVFSIDYTIEVTGTCVMDTDKMTFNRIFPNIRGYRIVVRKSEDIRILAKPSWWTSTRLVSVIGALLALVVGILLWNILLRRIISRRSRELETEIVARVGSELKVYERTRLAIELHDAISQNLTGAALALRAADSVADDDPQKLHANLSIALQTLDSCRDELRNCIWDLRNLTLDESSVDEAIRKTVQPHVGDATLVVRFNVPRERFSDNTIHAILHVIRELASNAVRHGHATEIRIAGAIEEDQLLFSVKDNGCGFDPATSPGMTQGHFGLQGIRDRIKTFEGETTVASQPGKGTKVTIALHVPQQDSGGGK